MITGVVGSCLAGVAVFSFEGLAVASPRDICEFRWTSFECLAALKDFSTKQCDALHALTAAASELAYEWDSESTNYKTTINKQADVYLIAVNDDAIDDVTDQLFLPGKVVAHTAASVPKEVLKNVTNHYGVFYPLQSLRKDMMTLPDVPIFFDGSDAKAKSLLEQLARSISAEKVMEASDDDRLKLHVAAVVVSNFVNHLYSL